MSTESIQIGCSPAAESCAQVGAPEYEQRSRAECRALVNQLRRAFGTEPPGARLVVRSHPHDFGSYREVEVSVGAAFGEELSAKQERAAWDYALRCESELPEEWDAAALEELRTAGFDPRAERSE